MRALALSVVISSAALGCNQTRQIESPNQRTAQAQFADTGFVRKNCVEPDSVLAGKKTCVLMYQPPPVRIF